MKAAKVSKSKTSRINSLIEAFEALGATPPQDKKHTNQDFYPFSNENSLQKVLSKLKNLNPFRSKEIRVAIMVGQSSICSILPEIQSHCDVVLFADINPETMKHIKFLVNGLQTQSSRTKYKRYYQTQKKALACLNFVSSEVTPDLDRRADTLGDNFFLASRKRYEACRDAAAKLHFGFSYINLFKSEEFANLSQLLATRNVEVSIFNATNLYEWDAKISLARLRVTDKWEPQGKVTEVLTSLNPKLILHSVRKSRETPCDLRAKLSDNLESYQSKNEKSVRAKLKQLHGDQAPKLYPELFASTTKPRMF